MAVPDRITAMHKFVNEVVEVDGYHFQNCQFIQSKIVFRGTAPVTYEGCVFDRCEWVFDGPAENTLLYLTALYNGLGEGGRDLVESIFESIRRGSVREGILTVQPALHR